MFWGQRVYVCGFSVGQRGREGGRWGEKWLRDRSRKRVWSGNWSQVGGSCCWSSAWQ